MANTVVIGGGPAGLMAAEMLADDGHAVTVIDAMPSMGRKLLMAGKSGLNLTKDQPLDVFLKQFGAAQGWLEPMLGAFGPVQVQEWAHDLGQPVFTGSSGRVFPVTMKASPLLRAWLNRLASNGVQFKTRWRWTGWQDGALGFDTPDGVVQLKPDACVLALGGASWPRLGATGTWAEILAQKGVEIAPFKPANMGFDVDWSTFMAPHFGAPVKHVRLTVGGHSVLGEFVISRNGVEGGAIYTMSRHLRDATQPALTLDLYPDLPETTLRQRLSKPRGKNSLRNHLRKTVNLTGVKAALLNELARGITDPASLAHTLKNLPLPLLRPRPLAEAISTAGGIRHASLTDGLMLTKLPGVFCAGEMLDWEAPTGGYLITACLATGRHAGKSAATYLSSLF